MTRWLRDRRGVSAVEFAILAPAFIALVLGSLEFGRLAWARQSLQAVAGLGARCMGVLNTNCASGGAYSSTATQTYLASQAASYGLTLPTSGMTLARGASCGGAAGFSTVGLSYTFTSVLPGITYFGGMPNGYTLTASACFPNTH